MESQWTTSTHLMTEIIRCVLQTHMSLIDVHDSARDARYLRGTVPMRVKGGSRLKGALRKEGRKFSSARLPFRAAPLFSRGRRRSAPLRSSCLLPRSDCAALEPSVVHDYREYE